MSTCNPIDGGPKAVVGLVLSVALFPFLAGCEKSRLDDQVRELCAKDGGVKVYETVKVPLEAYDKWGSLTFWHPSQGENALGQEYIFREEQRYYRRGNPEMWRTHRQVIRRADMKLLGESVIYIRRGGDMPGPWHESSLSCPEPKDASVVDRVFVRARTE